MRRYKRPLFTIGLLLGCIALFCASAQAVDFVRAFDLETARQATCRVRVRNAAGTGAHIGLDEEKNKCVVVTNKHVVGDETDCVLTFWTNGVLEQVKGKVDTRLYDESLPVDAAFIVVDPNELKKINPPYIAFGGRNAAPDKDSIIISAGCPKGRFVQAWKGKVLGYYNGETIMFQPGPVPGQSGSPIISIIDGELWQTGILTWLIGPEGSDDSKGGGVPVANVYKAMSGRRSSTGSSDKSPIPPNAVECAETTPYVIEFSQDNCPPCKKAEKDVEEILASGFRVETYNISKSRENFELSQKYGVKGTPTFIVIGKAGTEHSRYIGAGQAKPIIADLNRLIAPVEKTEEEPEPELELSLEAEPEPVPEPEPPPPEPELAPESSPLDDEYCPISTFEQNYRFRAPVYEYGEIGFFDDLDSRWQNRGRNKPEPEPEPEPEKPKSEKPNGGIGGIFGGGSSLDGAIDKVEKRLEQKVDGKVKELQDKLIGWYERWRWRVITAFVVILIACLLLADSIKAAFLWCWRKFLQLLKALDEITKEETNELQSDEKQT